MNTDPIAAEAAEACIGRDENFEWYYDLIKSAIEKATKDYDKLHAQFVEMRERWERRTDYCHELERKLRESRAAHASEPTSAVDTKRLDCLQKYALPDESGHIIDYRAVADAFLAKDAMSQTKKKE